MSRKPWHPPTYTDKDVYAIQALMMYAQGTTVNCPGPSDVKRALDWIINRAAGTYEETFTEDEGTRCYLQGRRSVGMAIVKMQFINAAKVFND